MLRSLSLLKLLLPSFVVSHSIPFSLTSLPYSLTSLPYSLISLPSSLPSQSLPRSLTSLPIPCSSPGYFPDPSSCSAFYRCTGPATGHRYLCPAGTRFDPSVSNCNHVALAPPCNILSGTSTTSTSTTTLPTPSPSHTTTPPKPSRPIVTVTSELTEPSTLRPSPTTTSASPPSSTSFLTSTSSSFVTSSPSSTSSPFVTSSPSSTSSPFVTSSPSSNSSEVLEAEAELENSSDISEEMLATSEDMLATSEGAGDVDNPEDYVVPPHYSVSPGSAYPCPLPGYFPVPGGCREFWVCREVGPGLLSAAPPFRCPDRYLFDPATRLCQREWKVACSTPSLFYSLASSLAVTLREEQLQEFFQQDLTYNRSRSPGVPAMGLLRRSGLPLQAHYRVHQPYIYQAYPRLGLPFTYGK